MSDWLHVVSGPAAGQRIDPSDGLVIGREEADAASLGGDLQLSRRHARFRRAAWGALIIEDLGSTNGTLVNGTRIAEPHTLQAGDIVELGDSKLEVRGAGAPATGAPVAGAPVAGGQTAPRATPPAATPPAAGPPGAGGGPGAPLPPLPALPSQERAGAKPPSRRRRGALPVLLGGLLAAITAAFVVFLVTDDDGSESAPASGGQAEFDGTLYTLSNGFAPEYRNSVLAYRTRGGSMLPMRLREYPTGGTGSRNIDLNLAIDAEQEITHDPERDLLFAVNPGSDTVAVFRVAPDGALSPVAGSPFDSGGIGPASTGIAGNTLLVVNKGQDGVRRFPEPDQVATLTQFRIDSDGALSPAAEPITLPNGRNPTQVLVTKDGELAVVTLERGDDYVTLLRQDDGTFREGEPTPITDEQRDLGEEGGPGGSGGGPPAGTGGDSGGPPPDGGGPPPDGGGPPPDGGGPPPDGGGPPSGLGSIPQGALGMTEHPDAPVIYSELPIFSLLMVHEYDDAGRLTFVRGVHFPEGFLACWAKVSADGRFLYVANTGDHTIATFDVSNPRNPRHLQSHPVPGPGGVASIWIDEEANSLYALDHFDPLDHEPGQSNRLHAFEIGGDGTLSGGDEQSLRIPVGTDVSPIGMLWLPREED